MCCEGVRRAFVNFRLKSCCFLASVKVGINIIAYFKILLSFMALLSDARFSPIANAVQQLMAVKEGTALPKLSNIIVILFNVLLLIGVNKKIPVLLRVFIYYSLVKISVMGVVLWPIIINSEDINSELHLIILTALSIAFQLYIMLLVRSVIVMIREEIAASKLPVQIIYTAHKEGEIAQAEPTVEVKILKPTEGDSPKEETNENADKTSKKVVADVKEN